MGPRIRNTRLTPIQIGSSVTPEPRTLSKILDGSLILCGISALLALLLVLDAYEYVVVPGASVVNGRGVQQGTAAKVESTIDIITDEDALEAKREIELALASLEMKRNVFKQLSVEEVEAVAEKDGVDDTQLKADQEVIEREKSVGTTNHVHDNTKTNDDALDEKKIEEDKEDVIEEIVEKELGIDEWCPDCIWLGISPHTCEARLGWLTGIYKVEENAGKISLLKDGCSKKNGKKKHDDARLLRG